MSAERSDRPDAHTLVKRATAGCTRDQLNEDPAMADSSMKTSVGCLVSCQDSRRSRPARVGLVRPVKPHVVRQKPHAQDSQRHKHAEQAGARGTA